MFTKFKNRIEEEFDVGEHVYLKGVGLTGYSGTIIRSKGWHYTVQLDKGQVRAGHTMIQVIGSNLRKEPV